MVTMVTNLSGSLGGPLVVTMVTNLSGSRGGPLVHRHQTQGFLRPPPHTRALLDCGSRHCKTKCQI